MCCSKRRHDTLANVIGVCINSRPPYVIVEFVDGESLRDLIKRSTGDLQACSWVQRVKVASYNRCVAAKLAIVVVVVVVVVVVSGQSRIEEVGELYFPSPSPPLSSLPLPFP